MELLPDLDTRSILNVVEENFQRVGQGDHHKKSVEQINQLEKKQGLYKTFAERMIYIGEHKLTKDELIENIQTTIHDVNSGYCDINVRGFLLAYDRYFVHIVEGSEDTLHRHLRFLFQREAGLTERKEKNQGSKEDTEAPREQWSMFTRLKLLMIYHSITTLYFEDWHAVMATPPTLISTLDMNGPFPEHMEQLRICLDKIRRLCDIARQNEEITVEQLRAIDPKMEALPEFHLLDYLLQSEYVLDLRYVVHLHRRVDDHMFYSEKIWPLPTQYTPRLLYKLKIDDSFVEPLPVMPWEMQKDVGEEEKEEEREEDRSGSSSD